MGYTNVQRWEASNGTSKDFSNEWQSMGLGRPMSDMSRTEQGCLLSHLRLWKHLIDQNIEVATIFEDDALFHPRFAELSRTFYDLTPKDYDMLFLGSENHRFWLKAYKPDFTYKSVDQLPVCCLHAYVITQTGAHKLLDLFRRTSPLKAIDLVLLDVMRTHFLKQADAGFVWYTWQAHQYPCPEFKMHPRWMDRCAGLVAQDYNFGSIISPHVYASTKQR